MYKQLKKLLRIKQQGFGRMAVRDRLADIKLLLGSDSPIIVDGGANMGHMVSLFLSSYVSPTIHAFEPIPSLISQMKEKFAGDSRVVVHGAALGAEAREISFNVVNNLVSSSVLMPSELNRSYHGERMDVCETVKVPQVTLDEVLSGGIDLIKLDLQGYELEALKGATRLLETTRIITTEVEFVPLYEGQPLFGDIDVYLRNQGFRLLNLYELYTHPDGQLTAGDAVYLNSRFF